MIDKPLFGATIILLLHWTIEELLPLIIHHNSTRFCPHPLFYTPTYSCGYWDRVDDSPLQTGCQGLVQPYWNFHIFGIFDNSTHDAPPLGKLCKECGGSKTVDKLWNSLNYPCGVLQDRLHYVYLHEFGSDETSTGQNGASR